MMRCCAFLIIFIFVAITFLLTKREYCAPPAPPRGGSARRTGKVLWRVVREGWAHSDIEWTIDQTWDGSLRSIRAGRCSGNGENVLGHCFCGALFEGARCGRPRLALANCTNHDDRCFYTDDGGVFAVSVPRWRAAQSAEAALWSHSTVNADAGDRVDEHRRDFDNYRAVARRGSNLGRVLEVGCGPWTQTRAMMLRRNFSASQLVLLDPGLAGYVRDTPSTAYRTGELQDVHVDSTLLVNGDAEALRMMRGTFDVVVMINVLEHVHNAVAVLRNVYNALRPGGTLVFNDRWWDSEGAPGTVRPLMSLDVLYHPVRIKRQLIEQFLSGFRSRHSIRDGDSLAFRCCGRNYTGVYFIGTRRG